MSGPLRNATREEVKEEPCWGEEKWLKSWLLHTDTFKLQILAANCPPIRIDSGNGVGRKLDSTKSQFDHVGSMMRCQLESCSRLNG